MCNNCNQNTCNGCTQEVILCNQCLPETCDCAVRLSTDCLTYDQDDIECNSVVVVAKNTILSDALNQIVSWSCTKFSELANYLRIVNVGVGAEIYAGDNLIGEKKIRRIKSTDNSVTITQGTDDIDFSVVGNLTYSAANIGTGANVYKDTTVVGSNTQFNIRKINTSNSGEGEEILKTQVENTNDISIITKTLTSTSLTITSTTDEISIEVPLVSEIPALIVNSAYTGIQELGTASKPFKTIQGALDAYKGTGGRGTILDPTNPELLGSIISVEKGSGTYTFTGDFDYKDIAISLKEGCVVDSTPTGGWLMDFNSFSTTTVHNPTISVGEGAYLFCNKNGFKLVGGDFILGTNNGKSLQIAGNAKKTGIILTGTLESDILFEVDGANLQYVNGGYNHLTISSPILTLSRGRMFVIKGNGRVICDSNLIYFSASIAVITNTYPVIEVHNIGVLSFNKASITVNKAVSSVYTQLFLMYDSAIVQALDTLIEGTAEYFAYNNSVANTASVNLDACKMYMITDTSFAGTISGVWANMKLNNNNMPNTSINSSTTSIVPSAINTIGGKLVETLNNYLSKEAAVLAGLPAGAKFINKVDITAGAFVTGVEYKIITIGTTDFTLIGASANTVGLYFTASGTGTGTGTASLLRVDIVA